MSGIPFEPQRRRGAEQTRTGVCFSSASRRLGVSAFLNIAASVLIVILALVPGLVAAESLDLELPTLAGDRFFRLAEVSGRRVVLNFWDTECPACIREMPRLDELAKARPEVLVLGVALAPRSKTLDFLDSHPLG